MATRPVTSLRTKEYDALLGLFRETREAIGVSQELLSQRVKRPITYVGKVELGTRRLDVIELIELCEALGQDPSVFVAELRRRLQQI